MSKDHWDHSFSDADYVYGETANTFIKEQSKHILENSSVACLAEGEGRNAVFLAEQGHRVSAYDQSAVGLKKTRDLAAKKDVHVETEEMDLTTDNVPKNTFDAAIMVFGHVHKNDQAFLFESLIDAVKPGGHVIFEVYSTDQLAYGTGGPPAHEMLYSPIDILTWIQHETCLHFYYGEAERNEGKRHSGVGHVIQVVVKKE